MRVMDRAAYAAIATLWAAAIAPASAHRLDEYLQASRLAIGASAIVLEIDLTPGVAIADRVFTEIDSDGDGEISGHEEDGYARRVLDSLVLSVDGRRTDLTLSARAFPARSEMNLGTGTIRLAAIAPIVGTVGVHRVSFVNGFSPNLSVYLANTLVPSDGRIRIGEQRRDTLQRSISVEYRVGSPTIARPLGWSVAAFGLIAALIGARRASR
jgi:hypothetical protein